MFRVFVVLKKGEKTVDDDLFFEKPPLFLLLFRPIFFFLFC